MDHQGRQTKPTCADIDVHRTITTDDVTTAALVDELRVRGIDPTRPAGHRSVLSQRLSDLQPWRLLSGAGPDPCATRDHLVLISESDTKFGRTLSDLFVDEIQRRADKDPTRAERGCSDEMIAGLHRFSYVRGLDGDAPKAPASANAPQLPDIVSLATGTDAGFKEPALGTNQFDYLRRLTGQIAELDGSLRQSNQGAIKAFAILGNDYFDKLLILQALKERFQSQLYLTTDLDAGYLDAKVFRWTRNLVIAAPFALTLRKRFEYPAAGVSGTSGIEPDLRLKIDQGEIAAVPPLDPDVALSRGARGASGTARPRSPSSRVRPRRCASRSATAASSSSTGRPYPTGSRRPSSTHSRTIHVVGPSWRPTPPRSPCSQRPRCC